MAAIPHDTLADKVRRLTKVKVCVFFLFFFEKIKCFVRTHFTDAFEAGLCMLRLQGLSMSQPINTNLTLLTENEKI